VASSVRWLPLLVLVLGLARAGGTTDQPLEQTIQPLQPKTEQRVEQLAPTSVQHIQTIDGQGAQQVSGDATQSAAGRAARTVGKVVVGALALVVSCGFTVASLLFF